MKTTSILIAGLLVASPSVAAADESSCDAYPRAKWTLAVWMNTRADDRLATHLLRNVRQLATTGGAENLHVVVQLNDGKAAERYEILKAQSLNKSVDSLDALRAEAGRKRALPTFCPLEEPTGSSFKTFSSEGDVDAKSIARFLRFVRSYYPADNLAFIVGSHGGGFRVASAPAPSTSGPGVTTESVGGFRVLEGTAPGRLIYSRDFESALADGLNGERLALLGMDSCLMGTFENAYSYAPFTRTFVGSETLTPDHGWNYELILESLKARPTQQPSELAQLIRQGFVEVAKYETRRNDRRPRIIAMQTDGVRPAGSAQESLAGAVDALGAALDDGVRGTAPWMADVDNARSTCGEFFYGAAAGAQSVASDLLCLCEALGRAWEQSAKVGVDTAKQAAAKVCARLKAVDLDPPAKDDPCLKGGADCTQGLSIYFPRPGQVAKDGDKDGYLPERATRAPVPTFVLHSLGPDWADKPMSGWATYVGRLLRR